MALLNETPVIGRSKKGFCHVRKHNLKTDMTPMVDLGFLLITFFVITVQLSKPGVTNLYMPKDGGGSTKLEDSNALTVIVDGNNKIYYYNGNMRDALINNRIQPTSFSPTDGIRKIIIEKQKWLDEIKISPEKRNGLMLLIKPTNEANYNNVMKVLDEVLINDVKKYALVGIEPEELSYLKNLNQ